MDCSVCLDPCRGVLKAPTVCAYCSASTCLTCAKKLALMWASAPRCANCRKAFTTEFMDTTFSKAFRRGPLRIQAIANLQEQELSLLPQTMEIVEQRRWNARLRGLTRSFVDTINQAIDNPLMDLDALVQRLRPIQTAMAEYSDGPAETPEAKKKRAATERTVKCPKVDCPGYTRRGRACALCDTKSCKDCNATLASGQEHACNPDDVASWTLIMESSKGCPKCGTPIQKVSGCNQMWCTVQGCNTAFDWSTGNVINGVIHNPHYHEWLARGGATAAAANADLECRGPRDILTNATIISIYPTVAGVRDSARVMVELLSTWLRVLVESADDWRMGLRERALTGPYGPNDHQDLRIDYLEGRLSKKDWATKLSTRETLRTKYERVERLHRMFQSAAADLVQKLQADLNAAAAASGATTRVHVDRGYRLPTAVENRPTIVDATVAKAIADPFFDSCANLQLYYNREKLKIYEDYTDKRVMLLWKWDYLQWSMVPASTGRREVELVTDST